MTTRREQYRTWGNALHSELKSYYGYGLGDLVASVDLWELFEVHADAETALALAGICYCENMHDEQCLTCKNEVLS